MIFGDKQTFETLWMRSPHLNLTGSFKLSSHQIWQWLLRHPGPDGKMCRRRTWLPTEGQKLNHRQEAWCYHRGRAAWQLISGLLSPHLKRKPGEAGGERGGEQKKRGWEEERGKKRRNNKTFDTWAQSKQQTVLLSQSVALCREVQPHKYLSLGEG